MLSSVCDHVVHAAFPVHRYSDILSDDSVERDGGAFGHAHYMHGIELATDAALNCKLVLLSIGISDFENPSVPWLSAP